MIIVPTELNEFRTRVEYIELDDCGLFNKIPSNNIPGLKYKYSSIQSQDLNDRDGWWYNVNAGSGYNNREFSDDNQSILKKYLNELLSKKDKICIVEIGVHRNKYNDSSTSIFLDNKRDTDIYVGIDIEDKSFLNDSNKNIFTIHNDSCDVINNINTIKSYGVNEIDLFMIDGWHSINMVYTEWLYTQILSEKGIVVFHDTNGHPGPYCITKSIDPEVYDVYKYFTDIKDYGIAVAVRK